MDGNKTGMALGFGKFKLGDEEYDTKLEMGDMKDYIKKLKSFSLKISYYSSKENVDEMDKLSNELLDYKEEFVRGSLIKAGMDSSKALELCGFHYTDIIKDGNIELWLGLINKKDLDKKEKTKN